jgi:hypothetical protein
MRYPMVLERRRMGAMWLGPVLFILVSVFLWKFIGAVFVPELMTRPVFAMLPALADMELVILVNAAIIYFGAYFVVAVFWARLRPYFRNPFLVALALWLVNVVLVFPALGKGTLGYRMPQGWLAVSFPLFVSHWIFARGLQFQDKKSHRLL